MGRSLQTFYFTASPLPQLFAGIQLVRLSPVADPIVPVSLDHHLGGGRAGIVGTAHGSRVRATGEYCKQSAFLHCKAP